ncbi:MAG: DNA-binding protein [Deltaproteobacteria bacterium]|nr:DNA-binding protein [Deltaproteobacteria bacterium]
MSLQNLLGIGQLEEHEPSVAQVRRMLASAERSIADATQGSISPETRLDAAYRAIAQLCMVALWANGYRPSRSRPGHHQTMIQSLVHSVELDRDRMLLLDAFRVKRNAIDYTGDDVDEASVDECIGAADNLLRHVIRWITTNKPALIA